jgi:beta-ribofuranosylaminobenzene 5'-phosphate synthase
VKAAVIRAFPRVHVALTDMGRATRRAFGGIGFSYKGPETTWRVKDSSRFELSGLDLLDVAAQQDVCEVAEVARKRMLVRPVQASLRTISRQHCGYGTKTAVLLGLLAALRNFSDRHASDLEIIELSRRGGASGIGIHAFFHGGVIWDGGHASETVSELMPSSYRRGDPAAPPLLARWPFPTNWKVFDLHPSGEGLFGPMEAEFFLRNAPIPRHEALESLGILCHGVIPAFAIADLDLLRLSLRDLAHVGFKRIEITARGQLIAAALAELSDCGLIAAGMSSTGPMMYAIVNGQDMDAFSALQQIASRYRLALRGPYNPCNHGHLIEWD